MDQGYTFRISDSYSPRTIPMERLAEYISALARLLGETGNVHLDEIFEGSVALRAKIDEPAQPKVRERLQAVHRGQPAPDALKAFTDLDIMLRRDNAYATLAEGDTFTQGGLVISFPGKRRPEPVTFGPFRQDGVLDGKVYRIGGADDTKHVAIRDGNRFYTGLVASEAMALRLRHHAFAETLRFFGAGTWMRHGDGTWELKSFKIRDFEVLDDAPLGTVIDKLRAVPGSHLREVPDVVQRLLEERSEGDAH